MDRSRPFSEFKAEVEAATGFGVDPDEAFDAFNNGVSATTFAKYAKEFDAGRIVGGEQSNMGEASKPEYSQSAENSGAGIGALLTRKIGSGQIGVVGPALVVGFLFLFLLLQANSSLYEKTAGSTFVPSVEPVVQERPLVDRLRQVQQMDDLDQIQEILVEAKAVLKQKEDANLQALLNVGQARFDAVKSASLKRKEEERIQRERGILTALNSAEKSKNLAELTSAIENSELYESEGNSISREHVQARKKATRVKDALLVSQIKADMAAYEGEPLAIAVGSVEVRRSFDGYSFDGNGRFVSVFVSVRNVGFQSEHVNPTNFTLETEDGYTVPYSAQTFATGRPLNAVNIGPGATTEGWIVFESALSKRYKLIHEPLTGGGLAEKALVP